MYAILSDGGRQYKVEEGLVINLDYREIATGETITLDRILLVSGEETGVRIGKPVLEGVTITGEVMGIKQGDKIYIQKFRRRKNARRRTGHRQMYTAIKINKINI